MRWWKEAEKHLYHSFSATSAPFELKILFLMSRNQPKWWNDVSPTWWSERPLNIIKINKKWQHFTNLIFYSPSYIEIYMACGNTVFLWMGMEHGCKKYIPNTLLHKIAIAIAVVRICWCSILSNESCLWKFTSQTTKNWFMYIINYFCGQV